VKTVNIKNRMATKEDINDMLGLLKQLFSIEADFIFDEEKQRRGLEMLFASENGYGFVTEVDGKVEGMCTVQVFVSTAEGGYSGFFEDFVINENLRKIGIGTGLIEYVEDWCEELDIKRLILMADLDNDPALNFYKKHNWLGTNLTVFRKPFQ